jgi:hypothetical protein
VQDVEGGQAHPATLRAAGYRGAVFKALFCSIVLFLVVAAVALWLRRIRSR